MDREQYACKANNGSLYGQQVGVQASPHHLKRALATRLINQGMPIHWLPMPLGHQRLHTTQQYARIYDETPSEQFKAAVSRLETIAVGDGPGVDVSEPAFAENWTNDDLMAKNSRCRDQDYPLI